MKKNQSVTKLVDTIIHLLRYDHYCLTGGVTVPIKEWVIATRAMLSAHFLNDTMITIDVLDVDYSKDDAITITFYTKSIDRHGRIVHTQKSSVVITDEIHIAQLVDAFTYRMNALTQEQEVKEAEKFLKYMSL